MRKGSDGKCGSELAGKNAVKARAAENKRWETARRRKCPATEKLDTFQEWPLKDSPRSNAHQITGHWKQKNAECWAGRVKRKNKLDCWKQVKQLQSQQGRKEPLYCADGLGMKTKKSITTSLVLLIN